MDKPYEVRPGVHILPSFVPLPGLGLLPVNAYLVKSKEPYVVDTGYWAERDAYIAALDGLIDLRDLRWIYLTHADPDHIGGLRMLMELAPEATLVTTFLGLGKLGLYGPMELARIRLLNPAEQLRMADRTLTVTRPPIFDAPETTAVYDSEIDVLFSSDCFGCTVPAPVSYAGDLPEEVITEGQLRWASVDAPWIHEVDRAMLEMALNRVIKVDPEWLLSSHLPPAYRMATKLCRNLTQAPDTEPFRGPSHVEFQRILAEFAATAPTDQMPPTPSGAAE